MTHATGLCITLLTSALVLSGCTQHISRERENLPDPREGRINELMKAAESAKKVETVVISKRPVLAGQPFQPEDLREVRIPTSNIAEDDLTNCWCADGHLARANFPSNHIIRQSDLRPLGFDSDWLPIHRASKMIPAGQLFTKENLIRRYVKISEEHSTDPFMHRATRTIQPGEIVNPSDFGEDVFEDVYYAKKAIAKGEFVHPRDLQLRVVNSNDLDEEWNYANCSSMTEPWRAARDIECGAAVRCSDFE